MTVAFVLIGSKAGSERVIYGALENIKEITEMHPVFGEYDILARVEIDSPNIQDLSPVVERVRKIPGVLDTKTLPGMPGYSMKK